jgi:hypothetical protein
VIDDLECLGSLLAACEDFQQEVRSLSTESSLVCLTQWMTSTSLTTLENDLLNPEGSPLIPMVMREECFSRRESREVNVISAVQTT